MDFRQRRLRLDQALAGAGVDGGVVTGRESVYYLTGFYGLPEWATLPDRVTYVARQGGHRALVFPIGEADLLAPPEPDLELIPHGRFYYHGPSSADAEAASPPSFREALMRAIDLCQVPGSPVAVDFRGLGPRLYGALEQFLGKSFHPTGGELLERLRARKDPEEIAHLEGLARVTEAAAERALERVAPGVSERQLACIFEEHLVRSGVWPELSVVGIGPRSALPNCRPGDSRAREGDVVRFDVGSFDGCYHTDMAFTVVAGRPAGEVGDIYDRVRRTYRGLLEAVRPGLTAAQVFTRAMQLAASNGLSGYRRHHCGHGIGLEPYETLVLGPDDQTELLPGMVLCVELPYYWPGRFGLQLEDMGVVTVDGFRRFTRWDRDLIGGGGA